MPCKPCKRKTASIIAKKHSTKVSSQVCASVACKVTGSNWNRAKRDTAVVSYSISESQHSGDRVTQLVGLGSYDAHLSVAFVLCDMQYTPNSVTRQLQVQFISYSS